MFELLPEGEGHQNIFEDLGVHEATTIYIMGDFIFLPFLVQSKQWQI